MYKSSIKYNKNTYKRGERVGVTMIKLTTPFFLHATQY